MSASFFAPLSFASRQRVLERLAESRRVFDRLDWWTVDAWAGSPAMLIHDDAALLILPPDLAPAQALKATSNPTAWVRWCAVSDGTSASPLLPRMLGEAHDMLQAAGVKEVRAIVHPHDWLLTYLQDAGYKTVDFMLTFECAPQRIEPVSTTTQLTLRSLRASELRTVNELDARCFEPAWRYPPVIMKPAFESCPVFVLAEWRGAPAGYCCALLNEDHGHVVRLAVETKHRRAGIGAALLSHVVHALGRLGATSVSLNTQGTNKASQRLYLRMGFSELLERPMVLCKQLAQQDGRAGA